VQNHLQHLSSLMKNQADHHHHLRQDHHLHHHQEERQRKSLPHLVVEVHHRHLRLLSSRQEEA